MSPDLEYSFRLPRLVLKALALFQHPERPNLACANLELRKNGLKHTLTLATVDGRRLATYETRIDPDTLFGIFPKTDHLIIDLGGCDRLPKVSDGDFITLEIYPKHVEIVADSLRYTTRRLEADVHFPDWRAIIPKGDPSSLTQFAVNHELLADFGKVVKWLSPDKPYIALRSFGVDSAIAVLLPEVSEFFGLIMPMKFTDATAIPEWLTIAREPVSKPAAQSPAADKAA